MAFAGKYIVLAGLIAPVLILLLNVIVLAIPQLHCAGDEFFPLVVRCGESNQFSASDVVLNVPLLYLAYIFYIPSIIVGSFFGSYAFTTTGVGAWLLFLATIVWIAGSISAAIYLKRILLLFWERRQSTESVPVKKRFSVRRVTWTLLTIILVLICVRFIWLYVFAGKI